MVGVYGMEYCTVGAHGSEILDYNMEGEYKSYTRGIKSFGVCVICS